MLTELVARGQKFGCLANWKIWVATDQSFRRIIDRHNKYSLIKLDEENSQIVKDQKSAGAAEPNWAHHYRTTYSKFGKGITEKFLKPYNEKVYVCDLDDLDANAMGRFFPYADLDEIISNFKETKKDDSYNNTFIYPRDGSYEFIKAQLTHGKITKKIWLNISKNYLIN